MTRRGIVDLGSNTIRLVVYEVDGHALKVARNEHRPLAKADFAALANEKKVVGLSTYVQDGQLSQDGIDKAVSVLRRHLETAHNLGCSETDIIATAVLRNCSNNAQAVAQIQDRIGHPVRVLSGQEESYCSFAGARLTCPFEDGLLIDMGGGSTELVWVQGGHVVHSVSLDQGCVSSYAQQVKLILPTKDECQAIADALRERLLNAEEAGLLPKLPSGGASASTACGSAWNAADDPAQAAAGGFPKAATVSPVLYGVGGGVRAAARMSAAVAREKVKSTPAEVSAIGLAGVFDLMESDLSAFSHLAVKTVPDRLHSLVPGCVILSVLMERFNAERVFVSKSGLREGYLSCNA